MNKKITFQEALLTAVGLVIGSGIFFRADNILGFTKGNITVAIIAWIVLGFTLIFAGIGMSVLAARSKKEGGIVGYMEECFGKTAAFLTGWFTTFIYIPLLIGIMGVISSGFLLELLGVTNPSAMLTQGVGGFLILMVYCWNYFSTKFAALFSSAATIIKLLPIVIIGVIGMTRFDGGAVSDGLGGMNMELFVAPLLSMAFAFDGWTTVATLSRDMENPQKDIAKVLAINAIIVTAAYTLYFTGVTMLMPAADIIKAEDGHVGAIAKSVLGGAGEKFILFCVVMSVLGTLNGNIMGSYRYPHALAQAKDLPNSEFFAQESKYGTTVNASFISLIAIVGWYIMYTIQAFAKEGAGDGENVKYLFSTISFDDIPIMTIAAVIIILLIAAMKYGMQEGAGVFKAVISPVIGIIGQGYVIYSFIQTNQAWWQYMLVCLVIVLIGFAIRSQVKKKQQVA